MKQSVDAEGSREAGDEGDDKGRRVDRAAGAPPRTGAGFRLTGISD